MKTSVLIPARNEATYIEKTLQSIGKNVEIIVIDDGSIDETAKIARRYEAEVIKLPDRGYDVGGKPLLARVINQGLSLCEGSDYICILGADHILPEGYLNLIIKRMRKQSLVIASGIVKGQYYKSDFPLGSGRVVLGQFWRSIGLKYPETYGWEDWLIYKALKLGYKVKCFNDILTETQRPMSFMDKGEIMYALGYHWLYALVRCLRVFLTSPAAGINMFNGFFFHHDVEQLDVASWVNKYQKYKLLSFLHLRNKGV